MNRIRTLVVSLLAVFLIAGSVSPAAARSRFAPKDEVVNDKTAPSRGVRGGQPVIGRDTENPRIDLRIERFLRWRFAHLSMW